MEEKIVYLHYKLKSHQRISQYIAKDPSLERINQNDANNYCQSLDCSFTTLLSLDYPRKLKLLANPPWVIYYKGDIKMLEYKTTAMISDYHLSNYAKFVTCDFIKEINPCNVVICCRGVGVGTLIEKISTSQKRTFICQSTAELLTLPSCDNVLALTTALDTVEKFKITNDSHILPALCDNLLIIEAALNSNINVIAKMSTDLGAEIYAVPGNIYAPKSQGTNQLIQDGANVLQWIKEV